MELFLIVLCTFLSIVIMFMINRSSQKKIGKEVLITKLSINRGELFVVALRNFAILLLALLICYGNLINNKVIVIINVCIISLYLGYSLFPIIFYCIYKGRIGAYENGIIAYDGIMLYDKMVKYHIEHSQYNKYDNNTITIYCKSTFPVFNLVKHFDIKYEDVDEYKEFFRKKHKQIKQQRTTNKNK